MKEKHKKRRQMLKNREKRARLWLFTDHKPKDTLHPIAMQDFRHKWLFRI